MSKTGRFGLAFASILCGAALGGCSSDSDAGPPVSMAGHWQFWMDITDEEIGPYPVYVNQNGSALDGASITGTVTGSSFTLTLVDPAGFDMTMTGIGNGNTAAGSLSVPALSLTGTFRMQTLATPTGTLNVGGDIGGQTVSIAATAAVGAREYSDVALTQLSEIEVSFGDATSSSSSSSTGPPSPSAP